jgi:serine/threonine-protein kinase
LADIGTILGGRYRLLELLGQGGMATIYRARDTQLERDVAVKVLRPEYGRDPDFFARFRQEAQSAASLNHPGVVAVYDYGTETAGPFIVMELVDGEDLSSIIRRSAPLPPRQAARLAAQMARAIAAAHANGFVHRDIKPGNILVTRDGQVKVTDFGIARAVAEAAVTLPGTTLGSVHYFSPEQARGELATAASDIYSLGIVLYELLTGRRPWEGDSAAAVATARLTGPLPSPSSIRAGIPPALEAITRRAMARAPGDRFPSADAMADALMQFLAGSAATGAAPGPAVRSGPDRPRRGAAAPGARPAGPAGAPVVGDTGPTPGAPALASSAEPAPGARIPFESDAYADDDSDGGRRSGPVGAGWLSTDDQAEGNGRFGRGGPWLWVSGVLALIILALAGFLAVRLLGTTSPPAPVQVAVPSLVGMTWDQAKKTAEKVGLAVARAAFEASSQPDGTVLSQDPVPGRKVEPGTTIALTLALGGQTAVVPDLRGKKESDALNLLAGAGLMPGTKTEAFDAYIPAGEVVSQDPGPGLVVMQGLAVTYVVSRGPAPLPSPSPAPSPSPSGSLAPSSSPGPANVGNYGCLTLGEATAAVTADGFTVGPSTGDLAGKVVAQDPPPGTKADLGSAIYLTFENPPVSKTCP